MEGRYVWVDEGPLRRLPAGFRLWVPMTVLVPRGPQPKVGAALFVDCSLYKYFRDPDVVRVASSFRAPLPTILDQAPVRLPELGSGECTEASLLDTLGRVLTYLDTVQPAELVTVHPARLALSHVLSATHRVLGDLGGMGEYLSSGVALSLLRELVSEIAKASNSGSAVRASVLHVIDADSGRVYAVVGERIIENKFMGRALREDPGARATVRGLAHLLV